MVNSRIMQLIVFCCIAPAALFAQQSIKFRGTGDWCFGDKYDQMFINSNQETVVGQVVSIDTVTPFREMTTGIQFVMRTEREDIVIHLGPSWFILFQDMALAVNDKGVEVRGCRISINGKPVIMASTLVKKDKVLLLRDKDGIPFWCAWRPKMMN